MDRRSSLKYIALTAFSGVLLDGCKPETKKETIAAAANGKEEVSIDRFPEEAAADAALKAQAFFTEHELATISVLSNIIIPADAVSGSATDAGVPQFIEFIVKDMPHHQVPLRGGLRWLDLQSTRRFGKAFKDAAPKEQITLIDAIAYPEKAASEMKAGVAFFSLMRNLVATGFYTTETGIKDLGYKGNTPNQWNGVPDDVLRQYGLAYTEKELKECISYT